MDDKVKIMAFYKGQKARQLKRAEDLEKRAQSYREVAAKFGELISKLEQQKGVGDR